MINSDGVMLKSILLKSDVVYSINDNLDYLLEIIPEIDDMIGFLHKHPHHHLDVWLHTLLALSLSYDDFDVRLSLLLHDIGKPHSYQEGEVRHFYNHPKVSSDMSRNILKRFDYDNDYIKYICYIIENHDNPIDDNLLRNNYEVALKLFEVQRCDALAHNPKMLKKRIEYLENIERKINMLKIDIEKEKK